MSEIPPLPEVKPWLKYKKKIRNIDAEGSTSIIFSALLIQPDDGSEKKVLMKILKSEFTSHGLKEVEIMSQIPHHPLICAFEETFSDSFGRRVIVTELCEGVNLKTYMKANSHLHSRKIMQIMLQIAEAIAHLHEHQIFHGDIKPANIMIEEKADGSIHIKLIDFGLSVHFGAIRQVRQGSPLYFSPEIAHEQNVDPSSDIWAFTVMLLQMLTDNDKPFFLQSAKSPDDIVRILKSLCFDKTPFPPKLLQNEDPNVVFLARIAQKCISLNRSYRPTAQEIVAELMGKITELGDAVQELDDA